MEYVKFRLDPRLIEELNIDAIELGDHLKKDDVILDIDKGKIIINDQQTQLLVEESLRIIYDLNTGKKKWEDNDAEIVFIKINNEAWYKTMLCSAGVDLMVNNRSKYNAQFTILK